MNGLPKTGGRAWLLCSGSFLAAGSMVFATQAHADTPTVVTEVSAQAAAADQQNPGANEAPPTDPSSTAGSPATSTGEPAQAGEIVVTGIRRSLERGIALKREAIAIRDSIVAEDIGKFPEANIADALVRLPGVELVRDDTSGEGREVRLRGLGSEFNVTTVNGAPVTASTGGNVGSATRSFNYDLFPSELFGRVDVYKTPLAELPEGGVAGVVDMRTARPMDYKGRVIRYTLAANYNDVSEKYNPRASFLFSDRFFDDKLGFLVSVAGARADNARTGFDATGQFSGANGSPTAVSTPAFDNRPARSCCNYAWNFGAPGASTGSFTQDEINSAFLPRIFTIQANENKRNRIGVTSSIQYRDDRLEVSLDGIYSKLSDRTELQQQAWPIRDAVIITRNGVQFDGRLIPYNVRVDENNNLQGEIGNLQYQNTSRFSGADTKYRYVALNTAYKLTDKLSVGLQLSNSRSNGTFSQGQLSGLTGSAFRDRITVDWSDPIHPDVSVARNLLDPNTYGYVTNAFLTTRTAANATNYDAFGVSYSGVFRQELDRLKRASLVASYDWDLGGFTGLLKTGGSISSNVKTLRPRSAPNLLNTQSFNGVPYTSLSREQKDAYIRSIFTQVNLDDVAPGGASGWPQSWLAWDSDYILGTLGAFDANKEAPLLFSGAYDAEEKITAVFAQTDWRTSLFNKDLRGNVGVRFVETDLDLDNYKQALTSTGFTPVNARSGYTNVLPSASIVYDLTSKLLLRAAWGKTLTRPAIQALAANISIPNTGNLFIRLGNPDLRPQRSTSLDGSVEWYFDRGGILALTAFRKSITDRAAERTSEIPFNQLGIPVTLFTPNLQNQLANEPDRLVTAATQINLEKYQIKGLEFFYQQAFRFLPAPFDGLGATASLTLIQTDNLKKRVPNLPTSPLMSFNVVPKRTFAVSAYWEKGPLAIRGSYNHKSEVANFTSDDNNQLGFQRYANPRGTLDASIAYKVLKNLEVRFDGTNLTSTENFDYLKHVDDLYGDPYSRVASSFIAGRTYTLSVRGSF